MGARKPQPEQNQAPVVQRIRIRYAKRGPLRFTSHRDFARAFERAVRRAGVPISYGIGASPTGMASEAEYLELGLQSPVDPEALRVALDAALSPGLDVLEAVEARPGPALADLLEASRWRIELPGLGLERVRPAVEAFLAA